MKEPDWQPELRTRLAEADVMTAVGEGVNMVLLAAAQVDNITVERTIF